jgi:transcriptional regulator with XRE-family HTH domain
MRYRYALGEVLRELRTEQHKTLRETAQKVPMALGYLSEIERGSKEISSEILDDLCSALRIPTHQVIQMTAYKMELNSGFVSAKLVVAEKPQLALGLN